jgi:hypothetical protein
MRTCSCVSQRPRIIARGLSECGIMAAPSERGNHLLSLRQIAAGLNRRGIPTARWARSAVPVRRGSLTASKVGGRNGQTLLPCSGCVAPQPGNPKKAPRACSSGADSCSEGRKTPSTKPTHHVHVLFQSVGGQGKRMKVCDPMAGALSGRAQAPNPYGTQQRAGSQSRLWTDLRDR